MSDSDAGTGSTSRALVLGGGGITGIAWETGLLHGLAEAGVDLRGADRVVGTSAGSIVGAQVTASPLALGELYERQLLPPERPGEPGVVPLASIGLRVTATFAVSLLAARGDVERFGRLLGRRAVAAADAGRTPPVPERYAEVRKRIEGLVWAPDRDLVVTAVDAATGERVLFGPTGPRPEVSLEDAVNASCAVPCVYPPIPIGGRAYVDGGVRSGTNADLAAGFDRVVAFAPSDRSLGPMRSAGDLLSDLDVPHLVVTPDDDARAAIGRNVLDPAARPGSARAGYAQAARVAEQVAAVWD
ncbi:MAG: patatin [Nocardioides sp.]|nr:patatin [Nocardioides sp.]